MKTLSVIGATLALSAMALAAAPQVQARGGPSGGSPPGGGGPPAGGPPAGGSPGGGPSRTLGLCADGFVTSNIGGSEPLSYTDCIGEIDGNDVTSSISEPLTTFLNETLGDGGWVFDFKLDDDGEELGPNTYGFSWTQISEGIGTWSVNTAITSPFVISLKAGNGYSAYFVDLASGSSTLGGDWATFNEKNLSHASLFVGRPTTPPPPTVPEPAATAALVLFGLTAIGVSKKKRPTDS